eukprot:TRINITY_DN16580_c0_g1_i5.p2 TRINITY_DN16580_c0_g1~~TRINITY_DN16580_c0_g1_i5.p2  ORF type:complete len:138 (+),score=9.99 TRINITY_DN16580_c0_g1_i5:223-636(+)
MEALSPANTQAAYGDWDSLGVAQPRPSYGCQSIRYQIAHAHGRERRADVSSAAGNTRTYGNPQKKISFNHAPRWHAWHRNVVKETWLGKRDRWSAHQETFCCRRQSDAWSEAQALSKWQWENAGGLKAAVFELSCFL